MLSTMSSLSGMQAASLRLTAAASNIANANSNGALPTPGQATMSGAQQPYQPVQVEQSSVTGPDGTGGTVATLRNVSPAYVAVSDPSASYANDQGMVAAPNVDMLTEILNMMLAEKDFELNAKVVQSVNDMVKKLYDLG